jgi:hypothetical protein
VDKNSNIPKKWNWAMRILWIEKWHLKVYENWFKKWIKSIDLQILEAEALKEKLKKFITEKEK